MPARHDEEVEMTRTVTMLLALFGMMASANAADPNPEKAKRHKTEALQEINEGKREVANEELKARQELTGDANLMSMEVELRNKLGDDWSVKKSGNGYLATRIAPKKADIRLTQKLNDKMRDFKNDYKDAQVSRKADEITMRGRIDDCADAARAVDNFAAIDGVNKLFVDVSCVPTK
jgi:hypothetical protein